MNEKPVDELKLNDDKTTKKDDPVITKAAVAKPGSSQTADLVPPTDKKGEDMNSYISDLDRLSDEMKQTSKSQSSQTKNTVNSLLKKYKAGSQKIKQVSGSQANLNIKMKNWKYDDHFFIVFLGMCKTCIGYTKTNISKISNQIDMSMSVDSQNEEFANSVSPILYLSKKLQLETKDMNKFSHDVRKRHRTTEEAHEVSITAEELTSMLEFYGNIGNYLKDINNMVSSIDNVASTYIERCKGMKQKGTDSDFKNRKASLKKLKDVSGSITELYGICRLLSTLLAERMTNIELTVDAIYKKK